MVERGEEALRLLREWGLPVADVVHPQPYVELQTMPETMFPQTGTTGGARWYAKSGNLTELTDEVIDIVVAAAEKSPVATTGHPDLPIIALWRLGGALSRVSPDAMAFTCADSAYYWDSTVNWQDPQEDERWISWERGLAEALEPHSPSSGVYLNFTSDDGTAKVQSAFGPAYQRLTEAKRRWDPGNVLRFNKNIPPASVS